MKVCVIGLGYVGLPLYYQIKSKGIDVIGFDIDKEKIKKYKEGVINIESKIVEKYKDKLELNITSNSEKLRKVDTFIVCVPTPVNEKKEPDYKYVINAINTIIENTNKNNKPVLISIESTINPGTCEELIKPIFDKNSWKIDHDYYLVHCPERIDPGNKQWDVDNLPRVIGGLSEKSLEKGYKLYSKIIDAKITKVSSIKAAEMSKVVENTFRDINIAYVNQLAKIAYNIGVDIKEVIDAASTKPFAFMPHYPGVGVGGHCIPVDPYYLIEYAKLKGINPKFLSLAREINESMPYFTIEVLQDALNEIKLPLNGTKVLILGFSYKQNVRDDRETPVKPLIKILKKKKANVKIYDPYFLDKSDFSDLNNALKWAEAIILATAHSIFIKKIPKIITKNIKVFIDGRNIFNKEVFNNKGILYKGIGRP